ncbi:hypothetical protein HDV63DRAFT_45739 [Trichoderma sp. SZMC 28014]
MTIMDNGGRSAHGLVSPFFAIFFLLVVGDTLTLFFSAITPSAVLAAFYLHYLRAKWLLSCYQGVAAYGASLVMRFISDCEIGSCWFLFAMLRLSLDY